MMNFASLFNQFRSQSNNGLSELLEQSSTRMGRLLDQDSFLNEYKSGNPRVIQFMKYERFLELIEFVTVVGSADDKKRAYKYPLSACDILSIDNNTAIEFFFPDRPITVEEKTFQQVEVEVEVEVEQSPEKVEEVVNEESPKIEVVENKGGAEAEPSKEVVDIPQTAPESSQPVQSKQSEIKAQPITPEKKMKKIIKKEIKTVETTTKKEVQPLISKLMSYFDGEVNYTLAGYVSKILGVFFNKKPAEFFKYILQENVAQKVLNHAQSRSVGELIIKLLVNQNTICLDQRRDFYKSILKKLSSTTEVHVLSNISSYVCEIIQKIAANLKGANKIAEFNDVFFSLDVITEVIKNVMSDQDAVSVYSAPILFTYLTNVPFVLPDSESIIEDFKNLLSHFIDKSCEKLTVQSRNRPKLGTGRIKIVQILRFILKENILNCKDIIAKKQQFFPILINLMKEYQMNNLLHNEIIKILQIALTENQNSPLNNSILANNTLVNFITHEAEEDKKIKAGDSLYRFRKGYIAHVINLGMKLKELSQKNQSIKRLIQNPEFANVYETFIDKEVFNSKKSLAGFSMRKDLKHQIMFQKEDIIAAYVTFLSKCPGPIFEKHEEEEHINIEHPDLVEELQKQLQQNLVIKNKEEPVEVPAEDQKQGSKEPKRPDHPISEAEVLLQPNYWVMHLQYNVDDLLVDL